MEQSTFEKLLVAHWESYNRLHFIKISTDKEKKSHLISQIKFRYSRILVTRIYNYVNDEQNFCVIDG
jgi:hypothetical protein